MRLSLDRAPEKARKGEPCNGCGFCCAAEVCEVGLRMFGRDQSAPCPALNFHGGRFWCGLVKAADEMGMGDSLRLVLGVGFGCDSDDPEGGT